MTVLLEVEVKSQVQLWLERNKATVIYTDDPVKPVELTVPCTTPNEHYEAYLVQGETIEAAILNHCRTLGRPSPFNDPKTQTEPKLKPFTCKRCHLTLGFTNGKVFKSGNLVATVAQGSIVLWCECGNSRCWKPCE
jgi:hypothetical protein